ncbi:MAG TPA: hypothetical protein VGI61_08900 [Parafilimonas sp.]
MGKKALSLLNKIPLVLKLHFMSKSSETTATTSSGTGTGGVGGKGPGPKRIIEIVLLFAILVLVAYDTYLISQDHQLLQTQQALR